MEFVCLLLSAVVLSLASGEHHQELTVCPEGYPDSEGCKTLDQLVSDNLILSNTTFKFVPAMFQIKPNTIISFANVSNITLQAASPRKPNISCTGDESGLAFHNVSGLAILNMNFIGCGGLPYGSTLSLKECADIAFWNMTFKQGKGYGVLADTVHGFFEISNMTFSHYTQGSGVHLDQQNSSEAFYKQFAGHGKPTVTIANSLFEKNTYQRNNGGVNNYAIAVKIHQNQPSPMVFHITDVTVTNNTHSSGQSGSVYFQSKSPLPHHIYIEGYNCTCNKEAGDSSSANNEAGDTSSTSFDYEYIGPDGQNNTVIEITNSIIAGNIYGENTQINPFYGITNSAILSFVVSFPSSPHTISIRNMTIVNNTGYYDYTILLGTHETSYKKITFNMSNVNISNNTIASSSIYYKRGAVNLFNVETISVDSCSFLDNSGTALLVENSDMYFSGTNLFKGNKAYNGGGMALYWECEIYLMQDAQLVFEDNVADNLGGGLYIKRSDSGVVEQYNNFECFFYPPIIKGAPYQFNFVFGNNSAKIAGNDMYGGDLYRCMVHIPDHIASYGWRVMTTNIRFHGNKSIDVTSDAIRVCECSAEGYRRCVDIERIIKRVRVYPGQLFSLSLIAVGQLLDFNILSGPPSSIYAELLPKSDSWTTAGYIDSTMKIQNSWRSCLELSYRISSSNSKEVMVLTVGQNANANYYLTLWQQDDQWERNRRDLLFYGLSVPAYVEVELLKCPLGFEMSSRGVCSCPEFLKKLKYVADCSIDSLQLQKNSSVWLSVQERHKGANNSFFAYLTHEHCPFDYCKTDSQEFYPEDPDAQCNHNRSGVLCGECMDGYSLTLGRMECKECTNIYLLLLLPFALAGILLVLFLFLTDMTVAAGTINGLLFFANIVRDNQAIFFPPGPSKSFLSVFIAWLNLDLGISTCFYDGLDAYAFTWLQLAFPVYIWLLAFSIIIASRSFAFVNKLCGHTIVPVLATLFLLSYTKLQRTITASLSVTAVIVSNGSDDMLVWLKDGNIDYFQGKHIPLFLVNSLILLFLFIPYTLSITIGPWLQSKTHLRMFRWVVNLKPFFDAYFGPLKAKYRFWTGVLLLSRIALSVVTAANVLGDNSVNLLAIIVLTFVLMAFLWHSGGVYECWCLSLLDIFFLVNLGILASVTLYNKVAGGSQEAAVYVSTGLAFAVFCGIVVYHCRKRLMQFFCSRRNEEERPLLEKAEVDDKLLDAIDDNRRYN